MKKQLLIIIPAYNEAENIENVVEDIVINYPEYDYVVVNDGSKDDTGKICKEKKYNCIDLPVNLGLAGGFQAGMKYAYYNGYENAVQFDADGQHQPQYLKKMLEEMNKNYDIVIGSRFVTEKKSFSPRMLGSRVISSAIKLTSGKRIQDPTSGMRMYSRKMIKEFALNMNYGPEPDTVSYLVKNGASVSEVQVEMKDRAFGESYLNFVNSMKYMLKMVISIVIIQNFRKRGK